MKNKDFWQLKKEELKMVMPKYKMMLINDKALTEIYNALCCLNTAIRNKPKQKTRTKYIQALIKKVGITRGIEKNE